MDATDGTKGEQSARRTGGRGLMSYLAAIVVVPLCVVLVLSTELVLELQTRSGRTEEVQVQLRRLTDLSLLRFSLSRERSLISTIDESGRIGVPVALADMALGTDVVGDLHRAAEQTDRYAAAVQTDETMQALLAAARLVREDKLTGTGAIDPETSAATLRSVESAVRDRSQVELRLARTLADEVTGSGELRVAIAVLDESLRLHDAIEAQVIELFFALQADDLDAAERSRVNLARAQGQLEVSRRALADLLPLGAGALRSGGAGAAFDTLERSDSFLELVSWFDRRVNQPTKVMGTELAAHLWEMAPMFRLSEEVIGLDAKLIEAAIQDAIERSVDLSERARADTLRSLGLVCVAMVSSTVVVLLVVRALRRPLQRLEDQALHLLSGATLAEPLALDGPRELRTVTRAVNEFADNLAQIERQAEALARAALDDPSLDEPVTGTIGASLRAAFGRLGDAMGEQAAMRQRLAHDATHDPLTGLLNRAAALETASAALARASRSGTRAAVLFIDLDGFKQVNDLYGHGVGDAVLRLCVDRLRSASRAGDTVARLGGDEFLIVAEQLDDLSEAVALGERVVAAVGRPMVVDEVVISIGASVGVATGNRAEDVELIVADADLAVYQAKAAGKGQVEVYHPGMRNELSRRSALESDLRNALHDGSLELYFQPVTDADGRVVRSVEALLRWTRPGYGRVSPADFIPVAEASALINEIGRWVLRRAAVQLAEWRSDPALRQLRVAVNMSARHLLSRTFVHDVRLALEEADVPADRLIVEVTETALLTDLALAADHLRQLRAMGVGVALDDFGTGHTSFTQLKHLPIDSIKIDRSYIATLSDPAEEALTRIMTDIARVLGVEVVAEGVERDYQLDAIAEIGCGLAQGFLICPPLPPQEFANWLHNRPDTAPSWDAVYPPNSSAPVTDQRRTA